MFNGEKFPEVSPSFACSLIWIFFRQRPARSVFWTSELEEESNLVFSKSQMVVWWQFISNILQGDFFNDNSCSVCFVYSSYCGTETEQYEKKNNDKNYKCSPIVELFHTALAEAADIHQSSQSGNNSRSSLHCAGRWDKYFDGKLKSKKLWWTLRQIF